MLSPAEDLDSPPLFLADRIEPAYNQKRTTDDFSQHCEAAFLRDFSSAQNWQRADAPYPKVPFTLTLQFDLETFHIPLEEQMPSKKVSDGAMATRKFKQITSSNREIGLNKPLPVIKPGPDAEGFLLLDGNSRVLALKELGQKPRAAWSPRILGPTPTITGATGSQTC